MTTSLAASYIEQFRMINFSIMTSTCGSIIQISLSTSPPPPPQFLFHFCPIYQNILFLFFHSSNANHFLLLLVGFLVDEIGGNIFLNNGLPNLKIQFGRRTPRKKPDAMKRHCSWWKNVFLFWKRNSRGNVLYCTVRNGINTYAGLIFSFTTATGEPRQGPRRERGRKSRQKSKEKVGRCWRHIEEKLWRKDWNCLPRAFRLFS